MSAPSGNLLSEAELEALAEGVADGSVAVDTGFNTGARVRKHDLASEDSSLGVNLASIDISTSGSSVCFAWACLRCCAPAPASTRLMHAF